MFTWLKNLFSGGTVPEVINEVMKEEAKVEPVTEAPKAEPAVKAEPAAKEPEKTATKKTTKKSGKKGTGKCDFDKLTKSQLLAEAKHRGVKANASLSKAEILSRLKSEK